MLTIKPVTSKTEWETFISTNVSGMYPLFQSWNWGEVQLALGSQLDRLGLYDEDKLITIAQVTTVVARRGKYLHLRHGPLFAEWDTEEFDFFLTEIKKIGRSRSCGFIRISPLIKTHTFPKNFFANKGFRNAAIHNMDAEICWVLPLDAPEEDILKNMRKSHRYLIKKAKDLPLTVKKTTDIAEIDQFLPLYESLAKERRFVPHRGVSEEFLVFAKDDQAMLFLAEYEGKIISGALILFVGNMAIYHHGASLEGFRNIPASHAIQWEAIREAKRRGMELYNFWGIAPPDAKEHHPWQGLTLFKTGFGGHIEEFMHAKDLPLRFEYWKTFGVEYISRLRKGY